MPAPGDPLLARLFLAAWGIAFGGAFVAFALTPSTDFGLAAGWNRVGIFFGWQLVAAAFAIACAVMGWRLPRRTWLRRLSFAPLAVAAALFGSVTVLIFLAA